jgi:hypothetical protein
VHDVADPAEELLGEEAVLLDRRDPVPQAPQLEGGRRAEAPEADDEDLVVVGVAPALVVPLSAGVVGAPASHARGGE